MPSRTIILHGAVLALLVPAAVMAQRVTGRVVDEGTGTPIPGAFVVLLDMGDERQAAGLSGSDGFFLLDAPDAGEYRIRVDRIGYRSTTAGPFTITDDASAG